MTFRFLFDEHVSKPACDALQKRGCDVVHVLDVGLGCASDPEVFAYAAAQERLVVTRNYRDFVKLVEAYHARGQRCTGVLLLPVSLSQADVGAHVRAVEAWVAAQEAGAHPLANGFGWL